MDERENLDEGGGDVEVDLRFWDVDNLEDFLGETVGDVDKLDILGGDDERVVLDFFDEVWETVGIGELGEREWRLDK